MRHFSLHTFQYKTAIHITQQTKRVKIVVSPLDKIINFYSSPHNQLLYIYTVQIMNTC